MLRILRPRLATLLTVASLLFLSTGCTSFSDYVRHGFKVGPSYCPPPATVAERWIDQADVRVRTQTDDLSCWWAVFNDPVLNNLIATAYNQNLSVKQAGFRVMQARYLLAITRGELFPQRQTADGGYTRRGGNQIFTDNWNFGFNMAWELDFWGRFRRAVLAAEDSLEASVANYDNIMVTMLSDIAQNYVLLRTDQERIRLLSANVEVQRVVLGVIERQKNAGKAGISDLDVEQAISNLRQGEAAIPQLEINIRQTNNRLCTLMGMPPEDLEKILGIGPIPSSPPDVAVGIPADLLRRRPDVRQAQALAMAQGEEIGIAEAQLYPALTISGNLGYSAQSFSHLFTPQSFQGSVGPSFNWNILNYGRLINNVRYNDARFQELVTAYQNTVLLANEEVENGIVTFLRSQERRKILDDSVQAGVIARGVFLRQYGEGRTGLDFNRYAVIEQNLINQQDSWAQAKGQIAQGLIQIYRALGGGWEIRFNPPPVTPLTPAAAPTAEPESTMPPMPEELPSPMPNQPDESKQQP
jgi:NodT family efflux transporter outer membrane factor (OMF) lipoprotein